MKLNPRNPWTRGRRCADSARWERLLVDAAVIGGRDRWDRRLRGLEAEWELQLKDDEDNGRRQRLDRLRNLRKFAIASDRRAGTRCQSLRNGACGSKSSQISLDYRFEIRNQY